MQQLSYNFPHQVIRPLEQFDLFDPLGKGRQHAIIQHLLDGFCRELPELPPLAEVPKKNPEILRASGVPEGGWKALLDKEGPKAYAKAVREHKGLLLMDTTWRDAHQSLLATRMRTDELLRASEATSEALDACFSLEMWGGATFDVAMRFLHECPWTRLEKLRATLLAKDGLIINLTADPAALESSMPALQKFVAKLPETSAHPAAPAWRDVATLLADANEAHMKGTNKRTQAMARPGWFF